MITLQSTMSYWAGVAGRPLGAFEQLTIARPFHYNMLTRRWSRLIKPIVTSMPFGYVEVDLTFDRTLAPEAAGLPLNLLIHTQRSTRNDKYMSSLPDYEVKALTDATGSEDFVKWVLFDDLWSGIDVTLLMDKIAHKPATPISLCEVTRPESMFAPQTA